MTKSVQQMLDHCEKLLAANRDAYVDPDALAMAQFIIDQHRELSETRKALGEALGLFDVNWCPAHGHAPTPEAFDRATELHKIVQPDFSRSTYP